MKKERQEIDFKEYLPKGIGSLRNHQTALPRIAKDPKLTSAIEQAIRSIPTRHDLHLGDARDLSVIPDDSVHLILTSPPLLDLEGISGQSRADGTHREL